MKKTTKAPSMTIDGVTASQDSFYIRKKVQQEREKAELREAVGRFTVSGTGFSVGMDNGKLDALYAQMQKDAMSI